MNHLDLSKFYLENYKMKKECALAILGVIMEVNSKMIILNDFVKRIVYTVTSPKSGKKRNLIN